MPRSGNKSARNDEKIVVRKATLRDLEVLVAQRHAMFESIKHRTQKDHEIADRNYRRWAADMMRKKKLTAFLAVSRKDGRVVGGGCVWVRNQQPHPGTSSLEVPYLLSMYTEPENRGRGVATQIVKRAMAWSRENGFRTITLHASPMGRPVYEKLGFERTWEMRVKLPRFSHRGGSKKRPKTETRL